MPVGYDYRKIYWESKESELEMPEASYTLPVEIFLLLLY